MLRAGVSEIHGNAQDNESFSSRMTALSRNARAATHLACEVAALASCHLMGPLETPELGMMWFKSSVHAIEASVVSPSASAITLAYLCTPPVVHYDRPVEVKLSTISPALGSRAAATVARIASAHALLSVQVVFETNGAGPSAALSAPVCVRPSDGGWIARILLRPACWADASLIIVESLSLAGRPLPSTCLPATMRVGYNHAPTSLGAAHVAAKAGDASALQAALEAGGSTEEADEVRREMLLNHC